MGRSLLIVDDHPGFRRQARALLTNAGYDVVGEAVDGSDGVRSAAVLRPEIVLLDVQLPDISGFEAAALIREGPGEPAIVLISSREAVDFGQRIERSGARGFISKADLSAATLEAVLGEGSP